MTWRGSTSGWASGTAAGVLGATVTAVSAGIPGSVTVTGAGAGAEVRGPEVATTVRVGGAASESVATLAAPPVRTTKVVAATAASTPAAVRATRCHWGRPARRLLSATVKG